jgi:hypothetical protein
MDEVKKALVDVPVLLIFFNRPDTFKQVFEKVKEARPSILFLACDGPRKDRADDEAKIAECKQIAEDIDWECEVYKNYSEVNLGCGMRPYSAIDWAFSIVNRLVIIEDDCVVEPSLFTYQQQLLSRYEKDSRIAIISGFNHFKDWDCGSDSYFFTKSGATLAWGTWKRVWQLYDFEIQNGVSPRCEELLKKEIRSKRVAKKRIIEWNRIHDDIKTRGKIDYWDLQFGFIKYTQSMLTIVPKHNMVCNIGIGVGATHSSTQVQSSWKPGDILQMPTTPIDNPIHHPDCIICDHAYDEKYFNEMKSPNLFRRVKRKIKMTLRRIGK